MSGIGAITPSTAIRIIRPVAQTSDGAFFRRDDTSARQAYATSGTRPGKRKPFAGDDAAFIVQVIANDNTNAGATPAQGAIAYLETRFRLADLPFGFLIAKTA